jgi:nucleotide-binding universal stress UspA family protein
MNQSIVCGIDNSSVSQAAARVAARLARELGYRLVLVHVAEDPPAFPYGDARLRELKRRDAIADGTSMLKGVAATLADIDPETRVLFGDPVEALAYVTQSEKSEFLVIGSRGRGPLAAAVLGSVSSRLANAAACPVVVVPSAAAAHRFLVGTPGGGVAYGLDGSEASTRALRLAVGLAEHLELELLPVPVDANETRPDPPAETSAPRLKVLRGAPVRRLREQAVAADASAIVVGSHGGGPWDAAALGSLSPALVAGAPVPVIVVSPNARLPRLAESAADATVEEMLQESAHPPQQAVVNRRSWRGATLEQERPGRFSEGLEQFPDTASKLRQGRFSDGIEDLPTPQSLRPGRFSDGIEQRPEIAATVRRGSFADGMEDDVPTPYSKAA